MMVTLNDGYYPPPGGGGGGYNPPPPYYGGPGYGGRIVYFQIIRQHSKAACSEGVSYGAPRGIVWVDRGCEAVFRIVTRGGY